jgi:hypothetical protein
MESDEEGEFLFEPMVRVVGVDEVLSNGVDIESHLDVLLGDGHSMLDFEALKDLLNSDRFESDLLVDLRDRSFEDELDGLEFVHKHVVESLLLLLFEHFLVDGPYNGLQSRICLDNACFLRDEVVDSEGRLNEHPFALKA